MLEVALCAAGIVSDQYTNSSTLQRIQSNCSVQIALLQPILLIFFCFIAGFCSAAARNRIDSFVSHSKRSGYCAENVPPVVELFADPLDDSSLKRVFSNENNTLHEMQSATINTI